MGTPRLQLTKEAIGASSPRLREVLDLYERAFPEAERYPADMLLDNAQRPGVRFEAHLLGDALAALTYTAECDKGIYLLYLAVSEAVRGQGVGSAILADLRARAGSRPLVLDVEPPYDDAPNARQRRRRLAFYRRGGLTSTGRCTIDLGEKYLFLSTQPDVPTETLAAIASEILQSEGALQIFDAADLGVPTGDEPAGR